MSGEYRLSPVTASRRGQALAFIKQYLADHGGISPSYGEIAAGIGVGRDRAKRIVAQLAEAGDIIRMPGERRGITLPSVRDAAIRTLRELGYLVDEDIVQPAARGTNRALPGPPKLDYLPVIEGGEHHVGTVGSGSEGDARDRGAGGAQRRGRAPRRARGVGGGPPPGAAAA